MNLRLFKYNNPYTWKGWWHFVLVVPSCVREQHDKLIGLTLVERKSRKGCVLCYERTNHVQSEDPTDRQFENRWSGPHYVAKKDLQRSSKLEFMIQEGKDLIKSLPPLIRKLYEKA